MGLVLANRRNYSLLPYDPPRYKRLWLLGWRRCELMEYSVTTREDPPMLVEDNGDAWLNDNHLDNTDGGSVPMIAQLLTGITRDRFGVIFPWHDLCYQTGGLWLQSPGKKIRFVEMDRREIDELVLREGIEAYDKRCRWEAQIVWQSVKACGGRAWDGYEEIRAKEREKRKRGTDETMGSADAGPAGTVRDDR